MKTASEVQVIRCARGWWLARDEAVGLAATAKNEAEARERLKQVVAVYDRVMERAGAEKAA